MNALELLGQTATAYLARRLSAEDGGEGTARFLLDRLPGEHVAAISRRLLTTPDLANRIRLRIPRDLGAAHGLPEDVLTDERTTHWRNAACDRPVLLIANTDDDQGQSLRDITAIGSQELLGEPELWVTQALDGLGLPDRDVRMWGKALKGLQDARPVSLDVFARYVIATRDGVIDQGLPLLHALGWALPALRVPRDSAFFTAVPESGRTHAHQWKRLYLQGFNKRAPLLLKQTPSQQQITAEQLGELWQRVKGDVAPDRHPVIEAFISSPGNWNPAAEELSRLEWEQHNIKALFDGLRSRKVPLGTNTIDFFEDEFAETLTTEENEYLVRLDERQTREANDEDAEFYERHRTELGRNRALKARWDKFIFGQPVEASDLAVGLLRCLERLFEQAGPSAQNRKLRVEVPKRAKRDWLEMNFEAYAYFSHRYRGLRHLLTGPSFEWEVGDLFHVEQLVAREEQRGRFRRTASAAKAANQIRFDVSLLIGEGGDSYGTQLIWHFDPSAIYSEYCEDWERLQKHPFLLSSVNREPVSRKGQLQAIALSDVSTLMPVYGQDRGSLLPPYRGERDIAKIFPEDLAAARDRRRITPSGYSALLAAWEAFAAAYRRAVGEAFTDGVSSAAIIDMEPAYRALLDALHEHARGDANRKGLWEPVLSLGVVAVEGGSPAAIVAPWHPLRLLGSAVKARQMCGLVRHLMRTPSADFGDARVFFDDLAEELGHPYYPEVCFTLQGTQPVLLSVSDTFADYSLMEPPVATSAEGDATNENPTETARELYRLVAEYLDLQPHERANLSVVLYNCNSARLPQSLVNVLGELYEDDEEVRCQIVLRHRNAARLYELYEKILEGAEADSDSFVASEASRDFMARLRIGIMADSAPLPGPNEGPPTDLVFLQDVIARLAEQLWLTEPQGAPEPEVLHHVPPRWSRRRPMTRDDTRSVSYLACPVQPLVGWRYLQSLDSVIRSAESDRAVRPVPARQISFQHNATREIFEEVHRLGQWVVHSDDILTRRQLRNQGVQVIRHRQHRHHERNITISSRAPLNLLEVMVVRRLQHLNLGLPAQELRTLARRMVDDASDLSGDIVLRAAKRGQFANELIGIVLSRFLLEQECGTAGPCGWYFLDDYAAWLGQREEHLADILALSPRRVDNHIVLVALISEAKYVGSDALAKSRRASAVQLRETTSRIHEALFGNPGRLDRDLWLARLGDMILDGIEVAATEAELLGQWRHAIRTGTARILIRGYSHVFTHAQEPTESDPSERVPVTGIDHAWQEVYGRDKVRSLVLAYHRGESPRAVREQLGGGRPWEEGTPALPTKPVVWTAVPRATSGDRRQDSPDGHGGNGRQPDDPPEGPGAPDDAPRAGLHEVPPPAARGPVTTSGAGGAQESAEFGWASPALRRTLQGLCRGNLAPTNDQEWLDRTVQKVRSALLSYGLQAKVTGHRLTPNAALVRLQGSDRLRANDVEHRREELLTTHGLPIVNVLAEPGQVVVAVTRPQRQVVHLTDIWRDRAVDGSPGRSNRRLVLGVRESNGDTLYLQPGEVHAPHTLIAGSTGSGKSILLQNLLLDIAATNDCSAAQIVLIDPKQGADYLELQGLPHIVGGIIVAQDAARQALEGAVTEMERRYTSFRRAGVANLARYNAKVPASERMPVQWIFHDEFAVWMLTDDYKEMVSSIVQRLGVMARAAGIFLVFAAQRPEDRVMPLQLRDNLGNRLVLRVESGGTSRIALGEEGAERLLGRGHLAARLPDEDRTILAQVPILRAEEMAQVVQAIRKDCAAQ